MFTKHLSPSEPLLYDSQLLIVDGLNTFLRCFSAMPSLNDNGDHIGGTLGFLKSLIASIKQFRPTQVLVVFDGTGGSVRRKELFGDYKAQRSVNTIRFNRFKEFETPDKELESLKFQIQRTILYLDVLPVKIFSYDGVEADDVIAYLSTKVFDKVHQKITIISTDRDFLQLCSERVSIWSPVKRKLYTLESMMEEFQLTPTQYLLYRCFSGDVSDNVPGVKGVGMSTFISWFKQCETLEEIFKVIDSTTSTKKILNTLQQSKNVIKRNYELLQLQDVDISGQITSLIRQKVEKDIPSFNKVDFIKLLSEDRVSSLIPDFHTWVAPITQHLNRSLYE